MFLKSVFNISLIIIFISSVFIFIILFFVSAPYGRHFRKGWGPSVNEKAGWVIMEFPAFFTILLFFIFGNRQTNIPAIIFLFIWEIHYIQRTFIYPFLMKNVSKKFPIILILFAIIFNILNGFVNGYYLFFLSEKKTLFWLLDIRFIFGCLLFIIGFLTNIQSDNILRNLRKNKPKGYSIPQEGLFKYISCPNYFGEILEWTGFAIASWSISGLAFAIFTIANLLPRAYSHHKWYKKTFPDYPEKRKALIPFIF